MNLPTVQTSISEAPSPPTLLSTVRHLWWSNSSISERRDIRYGPLERHRLDIYEPSDMDDNTEMVIFIYGGGWEAGNKDLHRFIGRSWARHNYVVVLPDYHLAPQSTYPDQVEDVTRSVAWG